MKLKITWRNVLSKVGLHGRVHLGFVSTVLQYYQPADQLKQKQNPKLINKSFFSITSN